MARNRMIKPEFWEDDKIAALSPLSRLLFISLWNFSDDAGYVEYREKWLKAKCLPYDNININELIKEIESSGRISIKNNIILIKNFLKHQRIDKPNSSNLSELYKNKEENECEFNVITEEFQDHSQNVLGTFLDHSCTKIEVKLSKEEVKYNPLPPKGELVDQNFLKFWETYPKKKSKGQAEKAWRKLNPNEQLTAKILQAVELAKTSDAWLKNCGDFIPYPATWLNAKGWEDDIPQNHDPILESSASEVLEEFQKRFEKIHGVPCSLAWSERSEAKRLLNTYSTDGLRLAMDEFFKIKDKFYIEQGYKFGLFVGDINRIMAHVSKRVKGELNAAKV